ncbi:MAG: hypothetical protein KBT68_02755 [bacterium]|nr:hypothetical protein [Candidatus Colisoma equi]
MNVAKDVDHTLNRCGTVVFQKTEKVVDARAASAVRDFVECVFHRKRVVD